uniref:Cyclin-D1-binding protein 1-like N-terminal domain-containing protein n=1 Tax=Poecilia formosa TaxID=48698 RepID=A0A087X6W8_POEFO
MSAENCDGTLSVPLRNVSNSIQCIRDRVRDGESNEREGAFNLSNFWDTLSFSSDQAVKTVSQEATKLSLAFSRPPLPSLQDGEKLSEFILKSVLTLSTVYYWLPKSQGVTLRRQVRDATVEVLDGVLQLLEVIISSPLQSLTQEQITSTGGVWSACVRFARLPKGEQKQINNIVSNLQIVIFCFKGTIFVINTESMYRVFHIYSEGHLWPLMTESISYKICLFVPAGSSYLHDVLTCIVSFSDVFLHSVDDLALCLYPPMNYTGVENHTSKLAAMLRKFLELIRSSHVCGEAELSWVQFLEGAVDHNVQKAKELIELDG